MHQIKSKKSFFKTSSKISALINSILSILFFSTKSDASFKDSIVGISEFIPDVEVMRVSILVFPPIAFKPLSPENIFIFLSRGFLFSIISSFLSLTQIELGLNSSTCFKSKAIFFPADNDSILNLFLI